MAVLIGVWIALAATIIGFALAWPATTASAAWATLMAAACALAAFSVERQPVGEVTLAGRFGGALLQWGFAAGRGWLLPIVLISWLIWCLLGILVIAIVQSRNDFRQMLMLAAWAVDLGALLYGVGLALARPPSRGPGRRSFLMMCAALIGMLGASAYLWTQVGTDAARHIALLVAGVPPLFIGGGYGLYLGVVLAFGRKGRWN